MSALLLLWLIPVSTAIVAKRRYPRHAWQLVGISFGAIVSPASLGMYSLYYVGSVISGALGLIGLLLTLIHSWPGYYLALALHVIPSHTVVERFYQHLSVEILNGIIWLIVYGFAGRLLDMFYVSVEKQQPAH